MYKRVTTSLVNASRVVDLLIKRYDPERIRRVERLSEHAFRVRMNDGGMSLAFVQEDGSLKIREMEGVS